MATRAAILDEIDYERYRQINEEGWTSAHDDEHDNGQMAVAAACYAAMPYVNRFDETRLEEMWPWSEEWWKPKNPRRDLVRAAALIVAEIERLDRKDQRTRDSVK